MSTGKRTEEGEQPDNRAGLFRPPQNKNPRPQARHPPRAKRDVTTQPDCDVTNMRRGGTAHS